MFWPYVGAPKVWGTLYGRPCSTSLNLALSAQCCRLNRCAGNQFLADLTATPCTQWLLHVDMTDFAGVYEWAEYCDFVIGGPATYYSLASLGNYWGNSSESRWNIYWSYRDSGDSRLESLCLMFLCSNAIWPWSRLCKVRIWLKWWL